MRSSHGGTRAECIHFSLESKQGCLVLARERCAARPDYIFVLLCVASASTSTKSKAKDIFTGLRPSELPLCTRFVFDSTAQTCVGVSYGNQDQVVYELSKPFDRTIVPEHSIDEMMAEHLQIQAKALPRSMHIYTSTIQCNCPVSSQTHSPSSTSSSVKRDRTTRSKPLQRS